MWYLHFVSKSFPTVGQIEVTQEANIMCLSFTGVCHSNWEEEEDAKLCYVHFCLKQSDMLHNEIMTTSSGREWHDGIFSSFHVA
jgi:hypothetical protein